jgi:hypothetical protein
MVSGGHRAHSGPQADENSARSDARGFKLTALPAEGFQGEPPQFPLPPRRAYIVAGSGPAKIAIFDPDETAAIAERERELWASVWTTPQACAWIRPSERWRWPSVAMYVRTFVICEGSEATAADKNSLHRFGDQIGLTPAGLKENGWKVAEDQLAAQAMVAPSLSVVAGDDGADEPAPRRLRG